MSRQSKHIQSYRNVFKFVNVEILSRVQNLRRRKKEDGCVGAGVGAGEGLSGEAWNLRITNGESYMVPGSLFRTFSEACLRMCKRRILRTKHSF